VQQYCGTILLLLLLLTLDVFVQNLWDFMEEEILQVYAPEPLFYCPCAMRYDMYNLGNKGLVGRDFIVPGLHELAQYDGQKGVELQIYIVSTRERRQELMDACLRIPPFIAWFVREKDLADESFRGSIR